MKGFVDQLKAFNSKERHWLVAAVTGSPPLSTDFRAALGHVIGESVPPGAWWAMDFHLDWLEAASSAPESRRDASTRSPRPTAT